MRNQRLKIWVFGLLIIFLPFYQGCYDMRELEQKAFVLVFGIDQGIQKNNIVVTVMIAVPKNLAGSGGGGGVSNPQKGLLVTSVEGPSFPVCINLINTYVGREITLEQASFIFLGDEAVKTGIPENSFLQRYEEIRRASRLFVVNGKASEFINNIRPKIAANPNKFLFQILDSHSNTGLIPNVNLHRFFTDVESRIVDAVLPLCGLNTKAEEKELVAEPIPPYENYKPGEVRRIGGISTEFIGSAVFKKGKMTGILNGTETRIINFIQGEFKKGMFTFPGLNMKKQESTSLRIKQGELPDVTVDVKGQRPKINVKLYLEGEILASSQDTDYSKINNINKLEEAIENNINQQATEVIHKLQKLNSDPFFFGNKAAAHFLTWDELNDYGWLEKGKYRQAEVKVDTKIQIRRIGFQLGPAKTK